MPQSKKPASEPPAAAKKEEPPAASPSDDGQALPPMGMGPVGSGIMAGVFIAVPTALTAVLEPLVKPEEILASKLTFKDPLAAPIFAALFHLFVLQWLAMCVNGARVRYNVPWPTLYAEASHPHATAYNCVQRAHQHVLEQTPMLLTLLVIASFEFPLTAGVSSALFSASKVLGNVFGYAGGSAKKKKRGLFGYLGLLALFGLSVMVGLNKAGHREAFTAHVEVAYNSTAAAAEPYVTSALATAKPYYDTALAAAKPHAEAAMEKLTPLADKATAAVKSYVTAFS